MVPLAMGQQLERKTPDGTVTVRAVTDDVIRMDFLPTGVVDRPTEMLDPKGLHNAHSIGKFQGDGLKTKDFTVSGQLDEFPIHSGQTELVVQLSAQGPLDIYFTEANLYGMRGTALGKPVDDRLAFSQGLVRNAGAPVSAGAQGDGGAPVVYTKNWGIAVDSVDGSSM